MKVPPRRRRALTFSGAGTWSLKKSRLKTLGAAASDEHGSNVRATSNEVNLVAAIVVKMSKGRILPLIIVDT